MARHRNIPHRQRAELAPAVLRGTETAAKAFPSYGYTDMRVFPNLNIPYGENNPANEYSLINSNGVEYDKAGNLIADEQGFAMEYDADNQLERVYVDVNLNRQFDAETDTPVAEYAYDALGRRIMFRNHYDGRKIYGAPNTRVITRYVYDGQNVIAEFNTNGTRERYYVHGTSYIDERAVMHDDDAVHEGANPADYYYLLKDLYTVVGLVNKQGHEVERYVYDAYGRVTVVSTPTDDVDFNGRSDMEDKDEFEDRVGQDPCVVGTIYDRDADGDIDWHDVPRPKVWPWWAKNQTISASGVGNPYYFTGRRLDGFLDAPVGTNGVKQVYYYRTRSYDPINARFWQRDVLGYVDGMNLYEYVSSRPTGLVDPWGTGKIKYAVAECNHVTGIADVDKRKPFEKLCKPAQDCILAHERDHKAQLRQCCARYARARKGPLKYNQDKAFRLYNKWVDDNFDAHECQAYKTSTDCFEKALKRNLEDKCCEKVKALLDDSRTEEKLACDALVITPARKGQPPQYELYHKCPFDEKGEPIDWDEREEEETKPLPDPFKPRPPSESQPGRGGGGNGPDEGTQGGGPVGAI